MNIVCYGPWRAASLLWQPRPGAWTLTIACHAFFELAPRTSPIVAKPPLLDPFTMEETLKAPPQASNDESDDRTFVEPWGPVVPIKRQPEVIVVGHAYAPAGSKMTSVVARLEVGDVEKLLHVHGDTYFTQEGSLVGPASFTRMPLRWERAAGAPYTSNPVGVGMGPEAVADRQGRVYLPNLRPMGTSISRRDEVVRPTGFGPIRPTWSPRLDRLHRYAAVWEPDGWAEQPLPDDFDLSYFNAAPPDQIAGEITGSERIVLEHFHPRFPRLVTYLDTPAPCVVVSSMGVEQSVPLRCDTLVFDTDRGLAIVVWRGQVPLNHPQREGVVFVSPARLGTGSTGTVEGALAPGPAAVLPFQGGAVETVRGATVPTKPALPFQPSDAVTTGEILELECEPDDDSADTEAPTLRGAEELAQRMSEARGEAPPPTEPPPRPAAIPEAPPPVREPPPEAVNEPPPLPPPPPRATVASSIEHCATVAARLAMPRADGIAVLEAEELTPGQWESQHARWLGEINDELDRGKKKLLSAYDAAYVAALEEERGPIAAGEYARLAVAVDRGKMPAALAELGLPGDAMMRIRRVWLVRMVKDPRAAAEVRGAMRVAAEG